VCDSDAASVKPLRHDFICEGGPRAARNHDVALLELLRSLADLVSCAVHVILLWRYFPPADWSTAMLLLVIPGMIGEAVALSNPPTFVPSLHVASAGRHGAFHFATYGFRPRCGGDRHSTSTLLGPVGSGLPTFFPTDNRTTAPQLAGFSLL